MEKEAIRKILEETRRGDLGIEEAMAALKDLPYADLGFARLDHHRSLRSGLPEAVLGQGKTPAQVAEIAARLAEKGERLLITRAGEEAFQAVLKILPDALYYPQARLIIRPGGAAAPPRGEVLVISAGTADLPVAEEAALCAEAMGLLVERLYDVGVAGLHRLLDNLGTLARAQVIIVVAGMEGALASVVGGLTPRPVLAVPTSVGYGASFGGLAALLGMLNCCAPGVAVVNIDNGYGAAAMAYAILKGSE